MKLKHIAGVLIAFLFTLSACKKVKFEPVVKGESIKAFKLLTPPNNTVLALNSATPDKMVTISWSAALPGVSKAITYKWVVALKTGSIDKPILSLPSENSGKDTKLSFTYLQLDQALQGLGVAAGATTELIWSVVADNTTLKVRANEVFNITLTRFGNGASPFILLGPLPTTTPLNTNPSSTSDFIVFNWNKAIPAVGSPAVTYKVLFAERKFDGGGNEIAVDWSAPLFSIASDILGVDSFATVSYKKMSDSLSAHGFTSLPTPANIKWTVVATSGTWKQRADYENYMVIVREVKVYVVGSATPGSWDISQSTRLIEDPRFPGTYFTYIYLTGGNEIKFVNGQNWPPFPGAVDWGQENGGAAGNLAENGENNIGVSTSGVYRVTVDIANNKYYLQTAVSNGIGGMGMIGNFNSWTHPAVKMSYLGVNKFVYLVSMNNGNEFKFHDGNDWLNGTNSLNRWFGLDAGKLAVDGGSLNSIVWNGANGLVRAYFDGSDTKNLKYSATQGKVYLIGGGLALGDWNNSAGNATIPEMTYSGNGIWTINITLPAASAFKFIVEKGVWGYQYGDGGGGNAQWRNGDADADPNAINISAGTHTITLNEYNRTFTIL